MATVGIGQLVYADSFWTIAHLAVVQVILGNAWTPFEPHLVQAAEKKNKKCLYYQGETWVKATVLQGPQKQNIKQHRRNKQRNKHIYRRRPTLKLTLAPDVELAAAEK